MTSLWEKLDGKQLAILFTSVGGIVLAGLFWWSNYKLSSNEIQHLKATVVEVGVEIKEDRKETNQVIREVTKVMEQNVGAIEQNTKAVEQLNQNLFLKR